VDDEDDPTRQSEVAQRLFARAALLREANDNEARDAADFEALPVETDPENR
jgi:hypothetical protein